MACGSFLLSVVLSILNMMVFNRVSKDKTVKLVDPPRDK